MGKWEMVRLGDIGESFIGLTYKPENIVDDGIIVLRSGNVQNNAIDLSDIVRVDKTPNSKLLVIKGDILMCSRNGSANLVGKSAIISNLPESMTFGAFMMIFRSKSNPYITHFFHSPYFKRQLTNSATTTINQITKSMLDNVVIPLPPLDEQKRIAKNLDLASEIVKGYKEQLADLDKLVQSVFYEMFGDPITNKKGWEEKELGDIYEINPKKSELHINKDMEVSFIPMQAVSASGEIDLSVTKRFSEVEKGFTYFKENDVLFAKITPCMENGKGAVAKGLKNGIGFGSTEFHVLRGKNGYSEAIWLYYFTKLDVFREKAKSNMTGSAGQKRVPASYLAKYKLPVPPFPLQIHFAEIATEIEAQKAQIRQALTEAENLFNSLMQEYFE